MTNPTQSVLRRMRALPLPLLIAIGTVLLLVLLYALKPSARINPEADILPYVATLTAAPQTLRPMVTLYGRVESPRESTLSATVSAYVKNVLVEEGYAVTAGQVLVELDDSDVQLIVSQRAAEEADIVAQIASEKQRYQNDLKALKVEQQLLALAEKSTQRYEKLVSKNVGSDLNRDDAMQAAQRQALSLLSREYAVQDHPNRLQRLQAQLDKTRALKDQALLDLERSNVTAPFDGRVTSVKVSPGNRVRPGDLVVAMFDSTRLEVRAQIPSRYLEGVQGALNQGIAMDASLEIDGQRVALVLDRLAGAVAMGQGGVDGLFRLQQPDSPLTLGRSGELYLHMPPLEDVVALPPTAIYGQQRIYGVEDGTLHTIFIKRLGETLLDNGDQWLLVKGDIKPGTHILTTQLANVVGGMAVKLQAAPGNPE